jgi:hypothetical protein
MSFKSSNTKTYPELEYKYDMYITYNTKYEKFTDTKWFSPAVSVSSTK